MSSTIFHPTIVSMAHDRDASVQLINLTMTAFLVVAATVPAFLSEMMDRINRWLVNLVLFL
jgi:hypothetical protein